MLALENESYFSEVTRLLAEGHSVTIPTKGSSMLPFIVGGRDRVVLCPAVALQTGDIVLAHLPEYGYVLHRIYRLSGNEVTLMGDGNIKAVERCRVEDVVGRVAGILRNGRCVDCLSPVARRRARLWRQLLPLRRCLLFVYKKLMGRAWEAC